MFKYLHWNPTTFQLSESLPHSIIHTYEKPKSISTREIPLNILESLPNALLKASQKESLKLYALPA